MKEHSENGSEIEENEEMLNSADLPHFEAIESNASMKSVSVVARGRPKIPNYWSRLIMMEHDSIKDIQQYSIDLDMQQAKQRRREQVKKGSQTWAPLFFTNDLLKEHDKLEFENFAIPDKQLRKYGR